MAVNIEKSEIKLTTYYSRPHFMVDTPQQGLKGLKFKSADSLMQ